MANQCEQLFRLLGQAGVPVRLVRTNSPYRPNWVGKIPVLRAFARLPPYLLDLWRAIGASDVVHVFANSGWAWHLLVVPALVVARLRKVGAIVNYRGGNADSFFASAPGHVLRLLAAVEMRVTPSAYLHRVFKKYRLDAEVIPNIVDLSRFSFMPRRTFGTAPHLIVTRNLEPIYDIPTALRAFQRVREVFPEARLTVAGSGPERPVLERLSAEMGLADCIFFPGRIDNAQIPQLYASADCLLNPSTVDNMPISILEAMACGVPVVSTDAGGIPDLVVQGLTGWLVPVGDDAAMARHAIRLLQDDAEGSAMCDAARQHVIGFSWPKVSLQWLGAYSRVAATRRLD